MHVFIVIPHNMMSEQKNNYFIEALGAQGKKTYEFKLCKQKLASKQNIRHHLFSAHSFSKYSYSYASRVLEHIEHICSTHGHAHAMEFGVL